MLIGPEMIQPGVMFDFHELDLFLILKSNVVDLIFEELIFLDEASVVWGVVDFVLFEKALQFVVLVDDVVDVQLRIMGIHWLEGCVLFDQSAYFRPQLLDDSLLLFFQLNPIIQESKYSPDRRFFNTAAVGSSQILSQQIYLWLILFDFFFQLPLVLAGSLVSEGLGRWAVLLVTFHFWMVNSELTLAWVVRGFL